MTLHSSTLRPVPDEPTSRRPDPTHCRVAGFRETGTQYAGELTRLLHRRLLVVTLLALVPSLLFLLRTLFDPTRLAQADAVTLGLHAGVTALAGGMAGVLWRRRQLSLCTLRHLEVVLFTSLVGFFSWLQLGVVRRGLSLGLAEHDCGLGLVRLWVEGSAVRWFFLIVVYGVFIPNTWQRAAVLTGGTALLPLVLTPLGAWLYDVVCPELLEGLLDLGILMGTAFAVAVFGAYRLEVLQQEAFQARRLGQYHLGQKLGAGGMGEVYEAEHVLLRRRCAIKLIRPDQTRDPETLARFEREVQAMATLTHWNTVEVYDYGRTDDGTLYYVMEYLDGLNLETLVARHGPVPPGRAIHLLRQVCQALHEAHGVGLLHRDIKPSNILACRRGGLHDVAKLLDFGLVQWTAIPPDGSRLTIQGAVLGSPPFMAPEQAAGKMDLDVRADIYSLGGVAYYLLTGQPPFVRETPMEMMLAHAYEPVPLPTLVRPGLPEDVQAIVLRCLNKKPENRFPDARALDEALAGCTDAGTWGEEQAAAWWRDVALGGDTLAAEPVLATPHGR